MADSSSGFTPKPQRPAFTRNITPKSRSFYSSKHSGSKAHLPQPKVLPFPDLPVRPVSRDSSRATSPIRMARTHSDLNSYHDMPGDGEHSGRGTPVLGFASSSTSPPVSSPLSGTVPLVSFNLAGPSRLRAHTGPSHASQPSNVSTSSIPVLAPVSTPARMEGFYPAPSPIPPPALSTSPIPSDPLRSASLPTPAQAMKDVARPPQPCKKLSNPPSPRPLALSISAMPSTQMLSEHMYQSFLKGTCADVRLWVRKWQVGWQVHRMVLVQAGFFHSLFTGGFSETTSGNNLFRTAKEKSLISGDDEWLGDDVELQFDDPNITRAAFEICLSRLYSPYPHLYFPVALLPTPSQPLSPSFSLPHSTPSLIDTRLSLPPLTILATPRLLLSLLATTIYLGQAPLMREVLAMVLRTIGPVTVGRYLGFAIGEGIGEEEWEGQTAEGARGLEAVGRRLRVREDSMTSEHSEAGPEVDEPDEMPHGLSNRSSTSSEDGAKMSSSTTPMPQRQFSDAPTITQQTGMPSLAEKPSVSSSSVYPEHLPHFYGYASNKIGESCVCWLARWGVDILSEEIARSRSDSYAESKIWAQDGIPSRFARAVLSSDHLFVKDEMERYRTARKVLDLRRKGWEQDAQGVGSSSEGSEEGNEGNEGWEEDEAELGRVFAEGIYYTHMAQSFDDLSTIAADIDPATSLPFAPLPILQAAHWSAADLRSRVKSASADAETSELELTLSTADIAGLVSRRRRMPRSRLPSPSTTSFAHSSFSTLSSSVIGPSVEQVYHPVPSDDTHRIGAGGLASFPTVPNPSGLAGLPDLGPEETLPLDGRSSKTRPAPQGESTFFGLLTGALSASAIAASSLPTSLSSLGLSPFSPAPEHQWTKLEPLRFSVEFFNLESLPEKERAYSQTVFYAGSYFNVYVQTIRKKEKGTQLGIYLHRQNPGEPFPTPSAPGQAAGGGEIDEDVAFPQLSRAISVPVVGIGSPGTDSIPLEEGLGREHGDARDVYVDTRRLTKAYFSISCSSALGTALLRFSSAPDSFTVSQSWGWKSSALRSEEYLTGIAEGSGGLEDGVLGWTGERPVGREGGLRACVVLGVI